MSDIAATIREARESREAIDDILVTIYRLQDTDRDTHKAEMHLQSQIEREFREIDDALDRLENDIK